MPMKWLEHFCDDRRHQVLTSIRIWARRKEKSCDRTDSEKLKSQFHMPMKWLEHFCDDRRHQVLTSIGIWEQIKENQTF